MVRLPEKFESHRKREIADIPAVSFPPTFTYPEMEKRARGHREFLLIEDEWLNLNELITSYMAEEMRNRYEWAWREYWFVGDPSHTSHSSSHLIEDDIHSDIHT
jgi:hypothetical protein